MSGAVKPLTISITVVPANTAGKARPRSCANCSPMTAGRLTVPQPMSWVTARTVRIGSRLCPAWCIEGYSVLLSSTLDVTWQDNVAARRPRCLAYLPLSRLAGLELRQVRALVFQERTQQRRIVGADGIADRGPFAEIFPPLHQLGLVREDAEVADLVDDIEIAECRTERGIDERESFAVEPWRADEPVFELHQPALQLLRLRGKCRFVRRDFETPDVGEHC